MKKAAFILLLIPLIILGGCKKGEETEETLPAEKPVEAEAAMSGPERIEVQHILISFQAACLARMVVLAPRKMVSRILGIQGFMRSIAWP